MNKLKPCPFCGSSIKIVKSYLRIGGDEIVYYIIKCPDIECILNSLGDTKKGTSEKWNRRAK